MFTTIANDKELSETVKDLNVIAWAEKSLREKTDFRDYYRKFIEFSLFFMGLTPPRGIYFMAPVLCIMQVDVKSSTLVENLDF